MPPTGWSTSSARPARLAVDRAADCLPQLRKETEKGTPGSLLAKLHTSADDVNAVTKDAAGLAKTIRPDIEKILRRCPSSRQTCDTTCDKLATRLATRIET